MSDGAGLPPFFQVGILVADLEAAMDELGRALGLTWAEPQDRRLGEWTCRVTFGRPGPPYLELIEGPPGSPWDSEGGYRLDHLGLWTGDLDRERARLVAEGLPVDVEGTELSGPWTYHRGERTGLRIEVIDEARRPGLLRTYGLDGP